MSPHRLRRGALHLPARRLRQNVNLFLREPKVDGAKEWIMQQRAPSWASRP